MNHALHRVASIHRAKLLVSSQSRYRTYTAAASASGDAPKLVVRGRATTLDEEFAAREAELLPPTHVEGGEKDPQLGDYPDIQTSNQLLPAKGWWDPQARRNYGDPVPERDEVLSMWGPDTPFMSPQTALRQFSLAALGFVSFGIFCKYALVPDKPAVPREYPFSGLVKELGGLEENKAREEEFENEDE